MDGKDGKYIDQSVMGLNLCVYPGIPELEGKVHIFKEENTEPFPGVHVRLGIVGESHFFSLRIEGERFGFTELLACMEPPPFEGGALVTPLRLVATGGNDALELTFPPFRYNFNGSICDATKENLVRVAEFKKGLLPSTPGDSVSRIVLEHDFSDETVRDSLFPPETLVWFRAFKVFHDRMKFMLNTVHTYPNEGKLVFTLSALVRDGRA